MATVGSIVVNLVAKTAAFRDGMFKATKSSDKFSRAVGGASIKLLKMGAVAATAAAAGLALVIRNQLKAIDATAKLSDTLGLTIQQLDSYNLIAGLSGVESAALGTAFKRMEKNISDANNGLSTAIRVFDSLGISIKEIQQLTPDEQFKAIAEGFRGINLQSERARVALDLFGRSGLGLIKVLELGEDGINRWQKAAEKLGISITREMAAKVEAANDAVLIFRASVGGLAKRLTVIVAPAILNIANKMLGFLEATKDTLPQIVKTTTSAFAMVTAFAAGVVTVIGLSKAITILVTALKSLTKAQAAATAFIGPKGWATLAAGIIAAAGAGIAVDQVFKGIENSAGGAGSEIAMLTSGINTSSTAMDDLVSSAELAASSVSSVSRAFEAGLSRTRKYGSIVQGLQTQILEFGLEGEALVRQQLFSLGFTGDEIEFVAGLARQLEGLQAKQEGAVAAESATPNITQFNKNLVSFSAGGDTRKTVKGDPEQTQSLKEIAFNTRNPAAVLGP